MKTKKHKRDEKFPLILTFYNSPKQIILCNSGSSKKFNKIHFLISIYQVFYNTCVQRLYNFAIDD